MDTCSDAALELEREGFDRELFLQLRSRLSDLRTDPVSFREPIYRYLYCMKRIERFM